MMPLFKYSLIFRYKVKFFLSYLFDSFTSMKAFFALKDFQKTDKSLKKIIILIMAILVEKKNLEVLKWSQETSRKEEGPKILKN